MEIYQFIAPAIAVYYIVRLVDQFLNNKRFLFTSFIWFSFWVLITALSIIPHELSMNLAKLLGFKSNINTIIFIALGFLIVLAFYLSSKVEKLETQVTELVRQLALDENRIEELEKTRRMKIISKRENAPKNSKTS